MLIESKYLPKNLLPALKARLSNSNNFDGQKPRYIEKLNRALQTDNPDDETEWQSSFEVLTQYASGILLKQANPSLFKNNQVPCAEETTLLEALSAGDTKEILEWMGTYTPEREENASASASLG